MWLLGRPFATYDAGGTHFYHVNVLESSLAATNQSGNQDSEQWFYPQGQSWQVKGTPLSTRFGNMGERDAVTGFDPTPARQYNNNLGRWMSPDPENAGAEASDPQSWNAYAYVRNNPATGIDPRTYALTVAGTVTSGSTTLTHDVSLTLQVQ